MSSTTPIKIGFRLSLSGTLAATFRRRCSPRKSGRRTSTGRGLQGSGCCFLIDDKEEHEHEH